MDDKTGELRADTRKRFASKVEAMGGSAAVSVALGCSKSTVDGIIAGRRGIGIGLAFRVERLMGIRMQEWPVEIEVEHINVKRIAS